jgi:hypothetical protein
MEALLQVQLGPIIAYDNFGIERWWFRPDWGPGADYGYWFNELHTIPMRRDDVVLTNSGALLYEIRSDDGGTRSQILAGVTLDLAYARQTSYLMQRVGLLGVYRVPRWGPLRDVAAMMLIQPYTHDRYLRGTFPFVGLLATVSSENLLPKQSKR